MHFSKASSSIGRIIAALGIHYNNSQNAKMQKQNKT